MDADDDLRVKPPSYHIENHGDGTYILLVNDAPAVKLDWLDGKRQIRWCVYGPCDLDRSIVLMQGFLHLTALLGNETRVYDRPPAKEEVLVMSQGTGKWQTSRKIRRSKN